MKKQLSRIKVIFFICLCLSLFGVSGFASTIVQAPCGISLNLELPSEFDNYNYIFAYMLGTYSYGSNNPSTFVPSANDFRAGVDSGPTLTFFGFNQLNSFYISGVQPSNGALDGYNFVLDTGTRAKYPFWLGRDVNDDWIIRGQGGSEYSSGAAIFPTKTYIEDANDRRCYAQYIWWYVKTPVDIPVMYNNDTIFTIYANSNGGYLEDGLFIDTCVTTPELSIDDLESYLQFRRNRYLAGDEAHLTEWINWKRVSFSYFDYLIYSLGNNSFRVTVFYSNDADAMLLYNPNNLSFSCNSAFIIDSFIVTYDSSLVDTYSFGDIGTRSDNTVFLNTYGFRFTNDSSNSYYVSPLLTEPYDLNYGFGPTWDDSSARTSLTAFGFTYDQNDGRIIDSEPFIEGLDDSYESVQRNTNILSLFTAFFRFLASSVVFICKAIEFVGSLYFVSADSSLLPLTTVSAIDFIKGYTVPYFNVSFWNLFSLFFTLMFGIYMVKQIKRRFAND